MGNCEIDPNAPLTPWERAYLGIVVLYAMACLFAAVKIAL